jgi:multicomponent Na+:H+ antiporter subunit D
LAGTATYVIGHGLTKAALFMLAGVLLHRFRTIDEFDLHGAGRVLPLVGALFAIGGLLLAAMPAVTTFFGKSLLEGAALDGHYPWLPAVFVISSVCTGGAVLRVGGRVFLGWGATERQDVVQAQSAREEEDEETTTRDYTPPLMVAVPAALLLAALVIGLIPGAVPGIERTAAHFRDHAQYIGWVLHGGPTRFPPAGTSHVEAYDYLYGAGATVGAIALAAVTLFGYPLKQRLPQLVLRPALGGLRVLRGLHSGHIGDYIAWWTAGAALLGGTSLVLLR